jgi:hypothetical protein
MFTIRLGRIGATRTFVLGSQFSGSRPHLDVFARDRSTENKHHSLR